MPENGRGMVAADGSGVMTRAGLTVGGPPMRNSGLREGQRNAHPSILSACPDFASLGQMQLQGPVFVGVPLLGPILICMFTPNEPSGWCEDDRKLSWCPPHKVILPVWATIYSVMG